LTTHTNVRIVVRHGASVAKEKFLSKPAKVHERGLGLQLRDIFSGECARLFTNLVPKEAFGLEIIERYKT